MMRRLLVFLWVLLAASAASAQQGTLTAANDAVTTDSTARAAVGFQLTGSCETGEVTFEGTVNGTDWTAVNVFTPTSSTPTSVATAAGVWTANIGGFTSVRMRVSDACDSANFTGVIRLTPSIAGSTSGGGGGGGGGDGAILDGLNGTIEATVVDYTNSNPLTVRLTDTNGDYVAAGAGTQYTEDAAAAANPIGSAIIAVRNDARTGSLTTTDGDNVAIRGTNSGELYVKHVDAVPVTDNGGELTVDGTVTVTDGAGALNVIVDSGSITANAGTDLNTSALLTTAAHDAAFGTAGTADAQVLSVQGIASMTPVQVSQATASNLNAIATIAEGGVNADVFDLTNSNPIATQIVDANGDAITSFGGGTEYDEDTAHVSGDVLKMAGVVQQTADTALAGNGDRTLMQVDANGFLKVNIKAGAGSGGTAATDNSTFTGSTTNTTPVGFLYDTTPPSITDGSVGAARMNSARMAMVEVASVTAAGPIDDTDVLTPTATDGTPMMAAVTADSVDSGDLGVVAMTTARALHVAVQGAVTVGDGSGALNTIVDSITAGDNNIGNVDIASITAGDNNIGNVDIVTLPAIPAGTNNIGDVDVLTLPALVAGTANIGDVDVLTLPAIPAGTNNIGDVDVASIAAGTNNIGDVDVASITAGDNDIGNVDLEFAGTAAATGGGSSNAQTQRVIHSTDDPAVTSLDILDNIAGGFSFISAGATEDEHAVKATAGTLWSVAATNTSATVAFLKCENDTAANTAPGTDTPEFRLAIPGATTGGGFTHTFPRGFSFSTALTCWIVTGAADSDVAEVAANVVMVFYTFE